MSDNEASRRYLVSQIRSLTHHTAYGHTSSTPSAYSRMAVECLEVAIDLTPQDRAYDASLFSLAAAQCLRGGNQPQEGPAVTEIRKVIRTILTKAPYQRILAVRPFLTPGVGRLKDILSVSQALSALAQAHETQAKGSRTQVGLMNDLRKYVSQLCKSKANAECLTHEIVEMHHISDGARTTLLRLGDEQLKEFDYTAA